MALRDQPEAPKDPTRKASDVIDIWCRGIDGVFRTTSIERRRLYSKKKSTTARALDYLSKYIMAYSISYIGSSFEATAGFLFKDQASYCSCR